MHARGYMDVTGGFGKIFWPPYSNFTPTPFTSEVPTRDDRKCVTFCIFCKRGANSTYPGFWWKGLPLFTLLCEC